MQPFWICQTNNGLKIYNEIMEMDRSPARMQICLNPRRQTENLFGVALHVHPPMTNRNRHITLIVCKVPSDNQVVEEG